MKRHFITKFFSSSFQPKCYRRRQNSRVSGVIQNNINHIHNYVSEKQIVINKTREASFYNQIFSSSFQPKCYRRCRNSRVSGVIQNNINHIHVQRLRWWELGRHLLCDFESWHWFSSILGIYTYIFHRGLVIQNNIRHIGFVMCQCFVCFDSSLFLSTRAFFEEPDIDSIN